MMYWTLHFIVTRLPDSLSSVRDHFLARCPTELTIDLLEKHLLAAEKSIVAVAAARGAPRTPIFEGGRRRNDKGKGAKGSGGGTGGGGGGDGGGGGGGGGSGGGSAGGSGSVGSDGGGGDGGGGGSGGGGGGGSGGGGRGGGGGIGGGRGGGTGAGQRQQQQQSPQTTQQLRGWLAQRGRSGGGGHCSYVIRTGDRKG
ncbi:unnamed protein product [Closterium sp. NIES-65]|nr:unnamed protein product [Closterium sp. NIES-65]